MFFINEQYSFYVKSALKGVIGPHIYTHRSISKTSPVSVGGIFIVVFFDIPLFCPAENKTYCRPIR